MPPLAAYPDVQLLVCEALAGYAAPQNIGTVTPADLQDRLPFLRVHRIGGGDDFITDLARVDVEVHAGTAAQAWSLAREIQQQLISAPARTSSGVLDRCRTESGPQEIPHTNDAVRLVITTYRVAVRR